MKPILPPAKIIGCLFLLAFVLYGVGNALVTSSSDELTLWVGSVLIALNSVGVVVIAALLFPILKRYSGRVAMSYLTARAGEAALLFIGVFSAGNTWAYQTAMLVLGVGSIGFCTVLYRARLVPKPLSVLGLVGYVSLAAGALCELWGLPIGLLMSIPGGIFELGFGLWLLLKGLTDNGLTTSVGD